MPPKKTAASKEAEVAHKFAIGDVVLGRIKGYPPWPAKIVDPETEYLTKAVLRQKPKYNAFLVRYYDDANYSWSVPKELKPLSKRDIEDFLNDSKKAKAALSQAYKTAADPAEWEADHAETMQEAREKAAAKAANADELADSDEEEAGSKKRKRKSEGGKKEANGKKAKGGKRGKDSDDDDKPAKKAKKANPEDDIPANKQCKEWRRDLQKGFLSESMPKPDDMPQFDKIFKDIEAYDDKAEYLENHKLPKVVKRIASLADGKIPRDDEFHIKSRATEIVNKWQQLFHPNGLPSAPIKEDEVKPTAVETTTTTGTKADDAMQVDEPAPAKEVEAAVETVTAAEKEEVAVPAEPAPVAEMEKPIESTATDAASTAIDTTGDAVAPSGEPSAAV